MNEDPTPVAVIRYTDPVTGARVLAEMPLPADSPTAQSGDTWTPYLPEETTDGAH